MPNIEDYWFRYKSACEIEGQKLEYISKPALIQLIAEIISLPVEPPVSQENGEDESFEIFDKLFNDLTKGKMSSGQYYWLTSASRIMKIAKKYLSRKELRELEQKYESRFSG